MKQIDFNYFFSDPKELVFFSLSSSDAQVYGYQS